MAYTPPTTPISQLLRPVQRFMLEEASSGVVLFLAAIVALVWANSPWRGSYEELFNLHLVLQVGDWAIEQTLRHWIDDGLMAVFFFVVGLEIKRALIVGELRTRRRATLPLLAAAGGMLAPAMLYLLFNAGGDGARGWGIPVATDIAFSLGVFSLLGSRAPLPLKIFLAAFAIIDDIGAVIVIAVFYTGDISWVSLGFGGVFLAVLAAFNVLGIRHPLVYAIVGVVVWFAFLNSGVHATIAGVLVAATIPIRERVNAAAFLARGRDLLAVFERSGAYGDDVSPTSDQRAILHELEETMENAQSPLERIQTALHPYVAFGIMPLFALSNAGLEVKSDFIEALTHPVALGVIVGLVVGKQAGVTLFSYAAVRLGIAELPYGVTWRQFYGVALLGGIGFTMSLFITNLAFNDALEMEAKIGVLVGSAICGVWGYLALLTAPSNADAPPLGE